VLSKDLGSLNLKHELYMYVYVECDLLMILLLMILTDMGDVVIDDYVDMR